LINAPQGFRQQGYEVELSEQRQASQYTLLSTAKHTPPLTNLAPWPFNAPLRSRQTISVRVRVWDDQGVFTSWSRPAGLEVGLLDRAADWTAQRIAAPWAPATSGPDPEHLFRKTFPVGKAIDTARLYVTAQGVYEAEVNGCRILDHFLAPGWTAYDGRLQYQTYDVTGRSRKAATAWASGSPRDGSADASASKAAIATSGVLIQHSWRS
jgi:alpha-L-rhamnosidase